jgi:lipopolysaccharide transport system ATP-binding protein
MRPIISVENLGKQYRLGTEGAVYSTIRETLTNVLTWRGKTRGENGSASPQMLWALRNINFEVKPGEVVGIIGRNGAGKSTLLKILSRITEPTTGRVELRGRVGSLLEVGTGFHPELTGRENIFLNGSILGMARKEIEKKFDEVVSFSELEKFIETPVKRYSSGMYMRLAFAVAAHLETEILLVDEVLAVGDARFQKKCLDKMQDVSKQGRTVFFVSHNMPAVTRLCERAILLDQGQVSEDGAAHKIVGSYLRSDLGTTAAREWDDLSTAPGNDVVRLRAVRVRDQSGRVTDVIDIRQPALVEMEYQVLKPGSVLVPSFRLFNEEGIFVFATFDSEPEWQAKPRPTGRFLSQVQIPGNLLAEGALIVAVAITTLEPLIIHFHETDAVAFYVVDSLEGNSARGAYAGHMPGVVRPLLPWKTRAISSEG